MMNAQVPPYATQVHPVYVHLQGLPANFFRVAPFLRLRGVLAITVQAAIPLTTRFSSPSFVLMFCLFAVWTCLHFYILAQTLIHSLIG